MKKKLNIIERKQVSDQWFVCIVIASALTLLADIIGSIALDPILEEQKLNAVAYSLASYVIFFAYWIVILAYVLIYEEERSLVSNLTWNNGANGTSKFFIGLGIGFAMNMICVLFALFNGNISLNFNEFRPLVYLAAFGAVYIQSGGEELLCRFLVFRKLQRRYKSPWIAILINSVFFALLHFANPGIGVLPMIDIFICGVAFSLVVIATDSFWMAVSIHCAWNYTQNFLFGLPNSGQVFPISIFELSQDASSSILFYDKEFGIEGSILSVIVNAILAIAMYVLARKNEKI